MSFDPYVTEVGRVEDIDGASVGVGVDYDTIRLGLTGYWHRLNLQQAEEFAALFVRACWEAGGNARQAALGELERADG